MTTEDVNAVDADGRTRLHDAARTSMMSQDSMTALHYAVALRRKGAVEVLLERGTTAKLVDREGRTAEQAASGAEVKQMLHRGRVEARRLG